MSVATRSGLKVVLPRTGPNAFWNAVEHVYAADDGVAWRQLAMLALKEAFDWPEHRIAIAFGRRSAEIARTLDEIRDDLRDRFVPG